LLVGFDTGDDAAVYRLDADRAIVFTTDFFTPIVDDAYDWGRIAAANALSDVYAMGGTPLLCLNIAGWPRDVLPFEMLGRVLAGGAAIAAEAGALVAGGHTIDDPEPKYGMAVVGLVAPDRMMTNARARDGDVLVLTKPIGIGVIATAIKNGQAEPAWVDAAIEAMTTLNAAAAAAATEVGVRAATDITGFGLLGHLREVASASGVAARIRVADVPVIEGASVAIEAGMIPGGTRRNRDSLRDVVTFAGEVTETQRWLLTDAQTSGGLLLACPPGRLDALMDALGDGAARVIGGCVAGTPGTISVD
jgi:selenide, water dikinase